MVQSVKPELWQWAAERKNSVRRGGIYCTLNAPPHMTPATCSHSLVSNPVFVHCFNERSSTPHLIWYGRIGLNPLPKLEMNCPGKDNVNFQLARILPRCICPYHNETHCSQVSYKQLLLHSLNHARYLHTQCTTSHDSKTPLSLLRYQIRQLNEQLHLHTLHLWKGRRNIANWSSNAQTKVW